MAWDGVPWFIGGGSAEHSADVARLISYVAFSGREGAVGLNDFKVQQTGTPSGQVQILPGAGAVNSRYTGDNLQNYAIRLPSAENLSIPPTDSSGERWDAIIARVKDPYPPSSSDPTPADPVAGPYVFSEVITDITQYTSSPSEVTSIDDLDGINYTAIVLAVLQIPASTATIIDDYITNNAAVINPRTKREVRVQQGLPTTSGALDEAGNVTSFYERWPEHEWAVTIPDWAVQIQVLADWDSVYYKIPGGTSGVWDARGRVKVTLQIDPNDDPEEPIIETDHTAYNFNAINTTNGYRCSFSNKDQVAIPEDFRGKRVIVQMNVKGTEGQSGRLVADEWSSFSVDMEFREEPTADAGQVA